MNAKRRRPRYLYLALPLLLPLVVRPAELHRTYSGPTGERVLPRSDALRVTRHPAAVLAPEFLGVISISPFCCYIFRLYPCHHGRLGEIGRGKLRKSLRRNYEICPVFRFRCIVSLDKPGTAEPGTVGSLSVG